MTWVLVIWVAALLLAVGVAFAWGQTDNRRVVTISPPEAYVVEVGRLPSETQAQLDRIEAMLKELIARQLVRHGAKCVRWLTG